MVKELLKYILFIALLTAVFVFSLQSLYWKGQAVYWKDIAEIYETAFHRVINQTRVPDSSNYPYVLKKKEKE